MQKTKNVLIIGAGEAGKMVCAEIDKNKIGYNIVGFLDDDKTKINESINSYKILGTTSKLDKIIETENVDIVLIAIPSSEGSIIRKVINNCHKKEIEFRIVPGIIEIIKGKVKINQIREVKPQDLLGRETVELDSSGLKKILVNRTVLVTGGAGLIGSELCN
jgi:FlaA1/EpsC-like NDP-sugar epimerase